MCGQQIRITAQRDRLLSMHGASISDLVGVTCMSMVNVRFNTWQLQLSKPSQSELNSCCVSQPPRWTVMILTSWYSFPCEDSSYTAWDIAKWWLCDLWNEIIKDNAAASSVSWTVCSGGSEQACGENTDAACGGCCVQEELRPSTKASTNFPGTWVSPRGSGCSSLSLEITAGLDHIFSATSW